MCPTTPTANCPQALRDASFSHKSDVFGFGVLVWEMCTLGRPPWGAFGVADVVQGLKDGERLQRPHDCPDQLYVRAAVVLVVVHRRRCCCLLRCLLVLSLSLLAALKFDACAPANPIGLTRTPLCTADPFAAGLFAAGPPRRHPPPPHGSSGHRYELCLRCWSDLPKDRPTFAQVNDELQILPAILRNTPAGESSSSRRGDARPAADNHTGYEKFRTPAGGGGAGVRIAMLETGPAGDDGYAEEPARSTGPARGTGTGQGSAPAKVASLPEMSGYTRISTDEIAAAMSPSPPHNLPEAAGHIHISTDQIAAATLVLGNGGGGGGGS